MTSWSVELGDGDLALIRYTQYIERRPAAPGRRSARRGAGRDGPRLGAGGRGGADRRRRRRPRATRLALTYLPAFPDSYRARTSPEEAPPTSCGCSGLRDDNDRGGPDLALGNGSRPASCASRPIARGGLIPLSEAVPVLENFGFRVLEEMPTALGGGTLGYIHDFLLEIGERSRSRLDPGARRRDRARDRRRAVRRGRERRVQPAGAVRRARSASRWSGCAPGSATCARPEAASAW